MIEEYNHEEWLGKIKGHEMEQERGRRCYECYKFRLEKTVSKAKEMKFDYFSTTLSVSPYKVYRYIKELGDKFAEEYNVKFYDQDYKKKDGFKMAAKLSNDLGLYRQNYCGCEFSKIDK